jgi:uncharacterized tellurite resistance protein B-like protein
MPAEMKEWFDGLESDTTFEAKNPEHFKRATASIICSIVNFNEIQSEEKVYAFCDLFKKEFHIDEDTANKLFEDASYVKANIEKNAQIIKQELGDDEYKKLQYMKMLNRFIIVDNCKDEDYCIFDELKNHLFA